MEIFTCCFVSLTADRSFDSYFLWKYDDVINKDLGRLGRESKYVSRREQDESNVIFCQWGNGVYAVRDAVWL